MRNNKLITIAKISGILIGCLTMLIIVSVRADYHYNKKYLNYWNLADKSSTIEAKSEYIQKFVAALEEGNKNNDFAEYNAIWLRTPDNNFRANMDALNSLNERLSQIKEMNPSSFEYNTAIQQITAQEQGEAENMLSVFKGCFELSNYLLVWGWVGGILITVILVGLAICLLLFLDFLDLY